jgi:hypothetical protein
MRNNIMNINISKYNNVQEFKKEFAGCLVQRLYLGHHDPTETVYETVNIHHITEENFNDKQIVRVFNPTVFEWYDIINEPTTEPEMITISKSEYNKLVTAQKLLNALEANGVDNWEGYYDSIQYAND